MKGSPLLSPGEDGVKSLEIANAIYLSSWLNETIDLPVDADLYYAKLQEKINTSTFVKKHVTNTTLEVKGHIKRLLDREDRKNVMKEGGEYNHEI